VRRYELMLVLRPDAPDDRTQAVIERATRHVTASGGQMVKVAPWGRRRLAYPIERYREGSYHILVFEAPAESIDELERSLNITEEVLRYLVVRIERPARPPRREGSTDSDESPDEEDDDATAPSDDDEDEDDSERIDESESEAAPNAVD
jgi:small subunit ribosomal protein S6